MRVMLDRSISKSEDKNGNAMKVQSEIRRITDYQKRSSNKVRKTREFGDFTTSKSRTQVKKTKTKEDKVNLSLGRALF